MALLRRGFSAYEALERVPLGTIRADLQRLGLCPVGTRIQLAKQYLVDAQSPRHNPSVTRRVEKDAPEYLKPFTMGQLEQAVRREFPDTDLSAALTAQDLAAILRHTQAPQRQATDLRSLVARLEAGKGTNVQEAKSVLPQLIDLDWMPQTDWSLLSQSPPDTLVPVWQTLFSALSELSKDEFVSLLKAVQVNFDSIGMNFSLGVKTLDDSLITSFLTRAQALTTSMAYHDLSQLAAFITRFHKDGRKAAEITRIGQEVLARLQRENLAELPYNTLNDVYFMLPEGCFQQNRELVSRLMAQLFNTKKEIDTENAWQCIEVAQRIGAPLPRVLLDENTVFTPTFLSRLSASDLLALIDSLISSDLLTEHIVKRVVETCKSKTIKETYHVLIDLSFKLHRAGFHNLLHNRLLGIVSARWDFHMTLEEALKWGIAVYPHVCGDSFSRKLLDKFTGVSPKEAVEHHALLEEMLAAVSAGCIEQPIYSYQFYSSQSVGSAMRQRLANQLALLVVLGEGDTSAAWRHHARALNAAEIPDKLLKEIEEMKVPNLTDAAVALWRHAKALPNVGFYAETLYNCAGHNFQALYYLSKLSRSLPISSRLRTVLQGNALSDPQFFLPLCEALGLDVAVDTQLLKYFEQKIEPVLGTNKLYGTPLQQAIIQMSRMKKHAKVAELSQFLGFIPRLDSAFDEETIVALTESLSESYRHCAFNLPSVFKFYEQVATSLRLSDTFWSHLSDLLSVAKPDLPKSLSTILAEKDQRRVATATSIKQLLKLHGCETHPKFIVACEKAEPNSETVELLRNFESARVFVPSLISKFVNHLKQTDNRPEALSIVQKLLSYISVVGTDEMTLQTISHNVDRLKLLSEMDPKAVIDFAFLHLETAAGKVPEGVIDYVIQRGPRAEEDVLVDSNVQGLKCYLPFKFTATLEPRMLETNDYLAKRPQLDIGRSSTLNPEDTNVLLKLHAVRNLLRLPLASVPESALHSQRSYREKLLETKNFTKDLEDAKKTPRLRSLPLEIISGLMHEKLGWVIDAAIPSMKIGILLYIDEDIARNSSGAELRLCMLPKVIKSQLEKMGSWQVVGVRYKVWKSLELHKKADLIHQIVKKFSS